MIGFFSAEVARRKAVKPAQMGEWGATTGATAELKAGKTNSRNIVR